MLLDKCEQHICNLLAQRSQAMLRDLTEHVAIPTGQGFARGLNEYRALIRSRLERLGATTREIPGSARPPWLTLPNARSDASTSDVFVPPVLLASHRAQKQSAKALIVGHLDTVHDPHGSFQRLEISNDRRTATGPGAVDMKGGIVIALHALEAIRESGIELNWTFLLNSDEETGSFHSFDALFEAAQQHHFGLVLEPALPDGSLVVERWGSGQFQIEIFGKSAHVGRDFTRGVSAVNTLAELIVRISMWSDPGRGVIVNVGPLMGGNVTNAVADHAACWGNVRFADQAAAEEVARKFVALATESDAMPRVVVNHLLNRPAKALTPEVQHLSERARAVAVALGQQLPFASTGGVCDGNILQQAGLPTLDTLGVRGGNLHRLDEFIELASLVERAQLFAVLLVRLGTNPGGGTFHRKTASK